MDFGAPVAGVKSVLKSTKPGRRTFMIRLKEPALGTFDENKDLCGWAGRMKIPEVARRARRRLFWNEVLAQGTCALSVGLGAVVLLLVLGTQLLDWRWLILLPVLTLAIGVYRTSRRIPGLYPAAQLVDRRLKLADAISTAVYFAESPSRLRVSEEICQAQLEQAERLADRVDVVQAIPFTCPRAVYAAGLMAFIATGLFALRYGLERRLDLRQPLASILENSFGGGGQVKTAALQKKAGKTRRSALEEAMGIPSEDGMNKGQGDLDAAPDSALETTSVPDTDNSKKGSSEATSKAKVPAGEQMDGEQSEGDAEGDSEGSNAGQTAQDGKQGGSQSKSGQQNQGNDSQGSANENSSLLSKMRDAMSNLLSRMKQQPQNAGAQQQAANNQNGQQGQGQKGSGQKAKSGQGKQQQGGQDSDSQEGEQGEDAQSAQNSQGKGAGQSSDDQASKQPGSGIGKQDGSKDVKLAEQMAAMGKISEIIGKRAANVSGEVTVEVQNSTQQLKTAWVQQKATHGNTGGEINRDEVPVEMQTYVQQYFEQVRKQDAPKKK
jgi:hypothetical protein